MEHTGFSSGEARGRMGVPRYLGGAVGSAARRQAGRVRRTGSGQARAGGMLVKAGLCGVVCAGVLLLRWAEGGASIFPDGAVVAASAQASQQGAASEDPDSLGRLHSIPVFPIYPNRIIYTFAFSRPKNASGSVGLPAS